MARKVAMQASTAVAANSRNDNVFQGQRYERAPFDGFLSVLGTGSAAGLQLEINVGGSSVSSLMDMNTNNRVPIVPDDLNASDIEVFAGQLIQVSVVNTTAGALTPRIRVEVEEGVVQYV